MSERRWDLVLRILGGPGASRDERVLRGPQLVVGREPGPSGLALPGGRGLAARHATLTAYDPQTVFVTPVGQNPVRVAPYPDVRWEDIEPIRERTRLSRGAAIHLGPTGRRGVTLEFVACRDLGLQAVDRLSSETTDDAVPEARPPEGYEAAVQRPRVSRLLTDRMPSDRFRGLVFGLLGTSAAVLLTALVVWIVRATLPPAEPPEWFWREVEVADWDPQAIVHDGFDAPIHDFVVAWDRRLAVGFEHAELQRDDPARWDPRLFGAVVASAKHWSDRPQWFRRFDEVRDAWATVVSELRADDLPEVLAAIPFTESCYEPEVWSVCCARGWWQFMPEFGARFRDDEDLSDLGVDVRECRYRDAPDATWTPEAAAPPPFACERAAYVSDGACNLSDCAEDFRTDLRASTAVARRTLGDALRDPTLAASGAAVQIAIASHHAGYDDAPLYDDDVSKPYNLLPAYQRWWGDRRDAVPTPHFLGDASLCDGAGEPAEGCQRYLTARTQRYVVKVIAQHLMAVCYYAENYPENPVFQRWVRYTGPGGYCDELDVPTAASLEGVSVGRACPR